MVCKDCKKGKIVLHAFSEGMCDMCNKKIITSHIPCDKLCETCSNLSDRCKECGNKDNGPLA